MYPLFRGARLVILAERAAIMTNDQHRREGESSQGVGGDASKNEQQAPPEIIEVVIDPPVEFSRDQVAQIIKKLVAIKVDGRHPFEVKTLETMLHHLILIRTPTKRVAVLELDRLGEDEKEPLSEEEFWAIIDQAERTTAGDLQRFALEIKDKLRQMSFKERDFFSFYVEYGFAPDKTNLLRGIVKEVNKERSVWEIASS